MLLARSNKALPDSWSSSGACHPPCRGWLARTPSDAPECFASKGAPVCAHATVETVTMDDAAGVVGHSRFRAGVLAAHECGGVWSSSAAATRKAVGWRPVSWRNTR